MIRRLPSNLTKRKIISRKALLKAFDQLNLSKMERVTSASSEGEQTTSGLQSIDDFIKEQDELDSLKGAEGGALLTTSTLTKKQRKVSHQAEPETA
jgi:hypothetical protein